MLGGTIRLVDVVGDSTEQIDNPYNIVTIEIGTGTQANPVTSIGNCAFHYLTSLTSVTIPNSVTSIEDEAFSYCEGLISLIIPNSVASIGEYAFNYCSGLTSITIPDSVTRIGDGAFYECSGLTSVTITANGGNAENVKQMMIDANVDSSITWNMPS